MPDKLSQDEWDYQLIFDNAIVGSAAASANPWFVAAVASRKF